MLHAHVLLPAPLCPGDMAQPGYLLPWILASQSTVPVEMYGAALVLGSLRQLHGLSLQQTVESFIYAATD